MVGHLSLTQVIAVRVLSSQPVFCLVAQLVEQCLDKALVAGSIPAWTTKVCSQVAQW